MTTTGRPPLLDPTKKEVIYALLQVGASQRRAAAVVGVSEAVIRYALKYDPDFAQRVAQAVALLEVELLVKLREGAARSWRAAVYALERLAKNPPTPQFDSDFAIEREFKAMEQAAQEQQEQAAAQGKPAPPPPAPDPNEPTTVASRQFAEQLNQLLAEARSAKDAPGSPTRKRGTEIASPHANNEDLLQEFLKNGPARQLTPEELLGNGHAKPPRRPR